MNILLVSPLPPPSGGIATWTKEVNDFFASEDNVNSVKVINSALTGKRSGVVSNKRAVFDEVVRTKRIMKALDQTLKSYPAEVVHINTSGAQFGMYRDALVARRARKHGIPVVVHFRCNVKDQVEYNRISRFTFSKLIKNANRLLVLNEGSFDFLMGKAKIPVEIVPNFTSIPVKMEPKEITATASKVIYVGQVRREKGYQEILEAAKELSHLQFHLYGTIDEEYKKSTHTENVVLHGNATKETVRTALDEADIFILPSYSEGFSNALAEAMARGLPCIASDVGANREMLKDGCGVCIQPHDSKALIDAIHHLQNQSIRNAYSQKALAKCKEEYTKEKVCKLLLSIWKSVKTKNYTVQTDEL